MAAASVNRKLAVAVVLVVACCAAAMVTPGAAARAYSERGGQPAAEIVEDCKTQRAYFTNCLGRGIREGCCGVVADHRCLCELEREAEVGCIPGRRCPVPKAVKIAEMDLSCMKKLTCKKRA